MSTLISGSTGDWEVVVGLEVHAQVRSESKLFSGASTRFGAEPNSQVSLVDAGMPGMLPVINRECVRQAVKTGLGLGAKINRVSVFDRKNYFYPDLPQGYQISQYTRPIVGEGSLRIVTADGERVVGIERIHLEQDAGKSMHDQDPSRSLIDLNRSGVALMEIVSRPDLRSGAEAAACLRTLRTLLRFLGTCDGNMQEGSLRCDANVSVRRPGGELGTRCEIKNLNSIRFLQQAIEYEAVRQVEVLEDGGAIIQETRLFDADRGETRSMRSKEDAHDYRYFPDPDLLPLELSEDFIAGIAASLPESPDARRNRFVAQYGIGEAEADFLVTEPEIAEFYEALADGRDARLAANWLTTELFGALNRAGLSLSKSPVDAGALGELIDLVADGTISGRSAKDVFAEMFETGQAAETIVDARGLRQLSDGAAIAALVDAVLAEHGDKVAEYRSGKVKLLGFFVGQVMKQTRGTANPQLVNEILRGRLAG
ncbi:MAG: Asp-tRNA(Asn)/Glu-tRNA(Gln) amidotransferase subunit GatB [Alphaproteobacteria bacterium]|nr:Asp-tRNA(Asn)/Glu-tRNA(Gln) amidotransferase subunit GatB [Alphaproteobacteria bacterium]